MTSTIPFGAYPPVPTVPINDFVHKSLPRETYDKAWHLVGPTIQKNLFKTSAANQHVLYCIAFIEGMRMALASYEEGPPNEQRKPELRETEGSAPQEPSPPIQNLGTERRVVYLGYPSPGDL